MRAGALDRRIVLMRKDVVQSTSSGEETDEWHDVMEIWAGRKDIRAAERFAAHQTIAEIDTVFTVRWYPGLEFMPDTYRIRDSGRIYNVLGITEIGRREGYEIAAAARAEERLSQNG